MRCFVAVDMSTPPVEACLHSLKNLHAPLRIVPPENLHVTLKFLGEVREDRLPEITAAMGKGLEKFKSFKASLKGLGVFPSMSYMRILWMGVDSKELIEMQHGLDAELQRLGFRRDKRFHPHLTLARIKTGRGLGDVREFLRRHEKDYYGSVRVGKVELKESVLTPKGPIYSNIFVHKL
jgi:2'-5' RNA ligase